jgi:hypothetical protein
MHNNLKSYFHLNKAVLWLSGAVLILALLLPANVGAERIFFAGYKGGFYIRSEEEGGMELRLGGALKSDYRYYVGSERPVP